LSELNLKEIARKNIFLEEKKELTNVNKNSDEIYTQSYYLCIILIRFLLKISN
jgi:hypothetical protein